MTQKQRSINREVYSIFVGAIDKIKLLCTLMYMTIKISATELRKQLFSLLLRLEKKPTTIIHIMKHDKVIGELSAPHLIKKGGVASKALLQIRRTMNKLKMPSD